VRQPTVPGADAAGRPELRARAGEIGRQLGSDFTGCLAAKVVTASVVAQWFLCCCRWSRSARHRETGGAERGFRLAPSIAAIAGRDGSAPLASEKVVSQEGGGRRAGSDAVARVRMAGIHVTSARLSDGRQAPRSLG